MLEKLEFEAQTGRSQPEIRRIGLDDRGPSDVGPDHPLSLGNIVLIDHVLSRGIHISTRHRAHTDAPWNRQSRLKFSGDAPAGEADGA